MNEISQAHLERIKTLLIEVGINIGSPAMALVTAEQKLQAYQCVLMKDLLIAARAEASLRRG